MISEFSRLTCFQAPLKARVVLIYGLVKTTSWPSCKAVMKYFEYFHSKSFTWSLPRTFDGHLYTICGPRSLCRPSTLHHLNQLHRFARPSRLLTKFAYLAKTHMLHIRRLATQAATVCESHRHCLLFTAKHKSVTVGKQTVLSHSVDYSAALPAYGQSAALFCHSQLRRSCIRFSQL
jgi:hypothetical protein